MEDKKLDSLIRQEAAGDINALDEDILHIPDSVDFKTDVCGRSNIASLLYALPQRERQIVILHAISELKHREISKLLSLPIGTVCKKYSESIKKLQKLCISR